MKGRELNNVRMRTIGQKTKTRAKEWAQQPKRRKNKVKHIKLLAAHKAELLEHLELRVK